MNQRVGRSSIRLAQPVCVIAGAAIVGKKEGEGPLGALFDMVGENDLFGCKTWEEAESNLQKDAVYMVMEKRWNSSQGLRDPRIKVVHSKRPAAGGSYKKIGSFVDGMVKDRDSIPEILKKWYPDMDFTNAKVYNDFNCMFYIHARMRKRRLQSEKTEKTGKTCRTT